MPELVYVGKGFKEKLRGGGPLATKGQCSLLLINDKKVYMQQKQRVTSRYN